MVHASFGSTNQQIYYGFDFATSLPDISIGIGRVPNWKGQENRDSRGVQLDPYCMGDITLGLCFVDARSIQYRAHGVQEDHALWSKKANLWPRYGPLIHPRHHHKGMDVDIFIIIAIISIKIN